MSNKRRKTIGATKIRRNLAIRLRRGNPTNPPGSSRIYQREDLNLAAAYIARGAELRADQRELVDPYWRGTKDAA